MHGCVEGSRGYPAGAEPLVSFVAWQARFFWNGQRVIAAGCRHRPFPHGSAQACPRHTTCVFCTPGYSSKHLEPGARSAVPGLSFCNQHSAPSRLSPARARFSPFSVPLCCRSPLKSPPPQLCSRKDTPHRAEPTTSGTDFFLSERGPGVVYTPGPLSAPVSLSQVPSSADPHRSRHPGTLGSVFFSWSCVQARFRVFTLSVLSVSLPPRCSQRSRKQRAAKTLPQSLLR